MGELFIVATPIGNLSDMTFRAVETLKNADVIAAEDTRNTLKLLNRFDIKTRLISYHEHSGIDKAAALADMVAEGKNVALVSDAGTPAVSDPGLPLIKIARERGLKVTPVPGACAAACAICVSAVESGRFLFWGFLDTKAAQKKKELEAIKSAGVPAVVYESPKRLVKTLSDIKRVCGEGTIVHVHRELTKIHEEYYRGTAEAAAEAFASRGEIKGEIVIIIECEALKSEVSDEDIKKALEKLTASGRSKKDSINETAKMLGVSKNRVYKLALAQNERLNSL